MYIIDIDYFSFFNNFIFIRINDSNKKSCLNYRFQKDKKSYIMNFILIYKNIIINTVI